MTTTDDEMLPRDVQERLWAIGEVELQRFETEVRALISTFQRMCGADEATALAWVREPLRPREPLDDAAGNVQGYLRARYDEDLTRIDVTLRAQWSSVVSSTLRTSCIRCPECRPSDSDDRQASRS